LAEITNIDVALIINVSAMLIQVGVVTGILKLNIILHYLFVKSTANVHIKQIILIVLIFLYFLAVLIKLGGVIGML